MKIVLTFIFVFPTPCDLPDDFWNQRVCCNASAVTDMTMMNNMYPDYFPYGEELPKLSYGNTFWIAIAAMAAGVVESLALCLLSRKKGWDIFNVDGVEATDSIPRRLPSFDSTGGPTPRRQGIF